MPSQGEIECAVRRVRDRLRITPRIPGAPIMRTRRRSVAMRVIQSRACARVWAFGLMEHCPANIYVWLIANHTERVRQVNYMCACVFV